MRAASPIAGVALTVACIAAVSPTNAQDFPSKPIRIIAPAVPGGGIDIQSRMIAQKLAEAFGRPVLVDNRGGGGGVIGTDIVAKAPADGYTLAMASTSHVSNPALIKKMPYDTIRDFASVTLVSYVPLVLVVHPSLPVKNVRELVAFAKKHPGELTYGSSGVGSSTHLGFELFALNAGIKIRHIPYKGLPLAMIDLVAGNTSLVFDSIPSAAPHIKSGRVRVLAIGSPQRSPSLPDVLTVAESGLPGYEMGSWYGLFAPAATPKEIVQRLAAETVKASTSADMRARFAGAGTDPLGLSAEESAALLAREIERWSKVARQAQIKAE